TGCTLAQADEVRRALGDAQGQLDVKDWFVPTALARGYDVSVVERIWFVLVSFASFGFCKAHAAAFALPTYQSAWLKRHYPAPFVAGLLTHDPGMYPKRLILEEARRMGIVVLGVDVNASVGEYRVERVDADTDPLDWPAAPAESSGLPDARGWGIRLSLADVSGMSASEVLRIVAGQPYTTLSDFWVRARVEAPVVERLVLAGGFDSLYGIRRYTPVRRPDQVTRRDLLLALADLRRMDMVEARTSSRAKGLRRMKPLVADTADPRDMARRQAKSEVVPARVVESFTGVQLALPLDDGADVDIVPSGLPEMNAKERLEAELEILGLDASQHVVDFYRDFLTELGVARSGDLMSRRNRSDVLVAGVKVATQTPPVRSGRRVVFLTLDDASGPVDATFFEDAQGPYAATVFASWLLVVRGEVRRTGPRGISLLAKGAWDLQALHTLWTSTLTATGDPDAAMAAVMTEINAVPEGFGMVGTPVTPPRGVAVEREAVGTHVDDPSLPVGDRSDAQDHTRAGGMGRRRVLVHASGFKQSPYADVQTPGTPASQAPRKLWHSSPGSSGR
ncbi:MAG TPA: OB-fold nucleic acid binding domain-containing protein, partial [Propionibacteriaceae bacterium]|nr:OB-fold nucleic acid binding domain-containing protein [Propionibacteriaceae bacterium]